MGKFFHTHTMQTRSKSKAKLLAASRSGNLLLLLYIVTAPLSRMCIAYSKRIQRILIAHICSNNKLLLYHRLISRTQQELGSVCILTYLCTPSFCIGFSSFFFLGQRKHQDIVDSTMSRIYFLLVQNHYFSLEAMVDNYLVSFLTLKG